MRYTVFILVVITLVLMLSVFVESQTRVGFTVLLINSGAASNPVRDYAIQVLRGHQSIYNELTLSNLSSTSALPLYSTPSTGTPEGLYHAVIVTHSDSNGTLSPTQLSSLYDYCRRQFARVIFLSSVPSSVGLTLATPARAASSTVPTFSWRPSDSGFASVGGPSVVSSAFVNLDSYESLSPAESPVNYPSGVVPVAYVSYSTGARHVCAVTRVQTDPVTGSLNEMHLFITPSPSSLLFAFINNSWFRWVTNGVYMGEYRVRFATSIQGLFSKTTMLPSNSPYETSVADLQLISNLQAELAGSIPLCSGLSATLGISCSSMKTTDPMYSYLATSITGVFNLVSSGYTYAPLSSFTTTTAALEVNNNSEFIRRMLPLDNQVLPYWSHPFLLANGANFKDASNAAALAGLLSAQILTLGGDNSASSLAPENNNANGDPFQCFVINIGNDPSKNITVLPRFQSGIPPGVFDSVAFVNEYNSRHGTNLVLTDIISALAEEVVTNLLNGRPDPYVIPDSSLASFADPQNPGSKTNLLRMLYSSVITKWISLTTVPFLSLALTELSTQCNNRLKRSQAKISGTLIYSSAGDIQSVEITSDRPVKHVPVTGFYSSFSKIEGWEVTLYVQSLTVNNVFTLGNGGIKVNVASLYPSSSGCSRLGISVPGGDPGLQASKPDAPTKPTIAYECFQSTVRISWNLLSDGGSTITQFVIYTTADNGPMDVGLPLVGFYLSWTLEKLTPGVVYTFRVKACNAIGCSGLSPISDPVTLPTSLTGPSQPGELRSVAFTSTSISLAWTAPVCDGGGPITTYILQTRAHPNGIWDTGLNLEGPFLTVTVSQLQSTQQYAFRVQAQNLVGPGDWSSTIVIGTTDPSTATVPGVPGVPEIVSIGCNLIRLRWASPSSDGGLPITTFVLYKRSGAGDFDAGTDLNGFYLEYTVLNLQQLRSYSFSVSAKNSKGVGTQSTASAIATTLQSCSQPGPPSAPVVTVNNTAASIQWSPPIEQGINGIIGYLLYYKESGVSSFNPPISVTGVKYTLTNLSPSKTYVAAVAAVSSTGTGDISPNSNSFFLIRPPGAPGKPTVRYPPGSPSDTLLVSWASPSFDGGAPIAGFKLYFRTVNGVYDESTAIIIKGYIIQHSVSALKPDVQYVFKVSCLNQVGYGMVSVESDPVSIQSFSASPPGAPTAPATTPLTPPTSVQLNWTAPSSTGGSPITGYVLYMKKDSSPFDSGTVINSATPTYTVTGLTPGSTYTFTVAAVNSAGVGSPSPQRIYNVLTPTTPSPTSIAIPLSNAITAAPIVSLPPANSPPNSVLLTWVPPAITVSSPPTTAYKIFQSTDGGNTWDQGSVVDPIPNFIVSGLSQISGYQWEIAAGNVNGFGPNSPPSKPVSISSLQSSGVPPSAPGAPTISQPNGFASDSVLVSWTSPRDSGSSPITGYMIYQRPENGSYDVGTSLSSKATSTVVSGLIHTTRYQFSISARNSVGSGPQSSPSDLMSISGLGSLFRSPGTPSVPRLSRPVNIGPDQFAVTWDKPQSDGGLSIDKYKIYIASDGGGYDSGRDVVVDNPSLPSTIVSNLYPFAKYRFKVSAHNEMGYGNTSPSSLPYSISALDTSLTALPMATVPSAPSAPTVNRPTGLPASSVMIMWNPPASDGGDAINNYTVQSAIEGQSWNADTDIQTGRGIVLYAIVKNLDSKKLYKFRVSASNRIGSGPFSQTSTSVSPASTTMTVPSAPSVPKVTAPTASGIMIVEWDPPVSDGGSPIVGYKLYTQQKDGLVDNGVDIVDAVTSKEVPSLPPLVQYRFYVRAKNSVGLGASSVASPYQSLNDLLNSATIPGTPMNVIAMRDTGLTSDSVIVLWSPPLSDGGAPVDFYKIFTALNQTGVYDTGQLFLTASQSSTSQYSLLKRGLSQTQAYTFAVAARNRIGWGPIRAMTLPVSMTSLFSTPTVPSAVLAPSVSRPTAIVSDPTSITLVWSPPFADGGAPILGYTLYKSLNPTNFDNGTPIPGNALSTVVTSLNRNQPYTFRLSATNSAGTGPIGPMSPSISVASVDARGPSVSSPPSQPILSRTFGIRSDSVLVSWNPPLTDGGAVVDGYSLALAPENGSFSSGALVYGSDTTRTVSGLAPNTKYSFQVAAHNVVGFSFPSPASSPMSIEDLGILSTQPLFGGCNGIPSVAGAPNSAPTNVLLQVQGGTLGVMVQWTYSQDLVFAPLTSFVIKWILLNSISDTPKSAQFFSSSAKFFEVAGKPPLTWVLLRDLPLDNVYAFIVIAKNSQGCGISSNIIKAKLTSPRTIATVSHVSVDGKPSGMKPPVAIPLGTKYASKAGLTSVALMWQAPADQGTSPILYYQINYRKQGTFPWTTVTTPDSRPSFMHGNVDPDTVYEYAVSGVNELGTGPLSNVVSAVNTLSFSVLDNAAGSSTLPSPSTLGGPILASSGGVADEFRRADRGAAIVAFSVCLGIMISSLAVAIGAAIAYIIGGRRGGPSMELFPEGYPDSL